MSSETAEVTAYLAPSLVAVAKIANIGEDADAIFLASPVERNVTVVKLDDFKARHAADQKEIAKLKKALRRTYDAWMLEANQGDGYAEEHWAVVQETKAMLGVQEERDG